MHKTVEAILERDGRLRLFEQVDLSQPRRVLVTLLEEEAVVTPASETALLSEAALAEDWNKPEEDEAWQHLQMEQ